MLTLPLIVTPRVVIGAVCIIKRVSHKGGSDKKSEGFSISRSFSLPHMACAAAADGLVGYALPAGAADDAAPRQRAQTSLFRAALERLPTVHDAEGNITTDGFVDLAALTLPLYDSFGAAFSIVRNDVANNCERIRRRQATDPQRFSLLYPIVLDEVERHDDDHSQSCTKAVLWLKRGMEFMLAIMAELLAAPDKEMGDVVYRQYHKTIHRWHGFVASSAFSLAFAFVPQRGAFLDRLSGGRYDARTAADMAAFVERYGALLAQVHHFLDKNGLDDPRKV